MTNPIFQVKNISVNGNEVEFDWGLKNAAALGLDWPNLNSYYDYFMYLPCTFNTALVKDIYVTLHANEDALPYYGGGVPGLEVTLGIVEDGVRNTGNFSNAQSRLYFYAGNYTDHLMFTTITPAPAGWDGGFHHARYQTQNFNPVDQNGDAYTSIYLYAKPFPADSEGFHAIGKYRVVLNAGQSMPDNIDDLMYFLTEPASEHPDGYDSSDFPIPGTNWSYARVVTDSNFTGFWEQEGYSISGAGAPAAATPEMKFGYYPLYQLEADSDAHTGGDGTSHSHSLDGVTYYMPNGLTMGVDQFHGTYGQLAQYDLDSDATDSVGSNDGSVTGVDFVTDSGRTVASFDESTGEKIDFGDVSDLNFGTGDFTLSAWIKLNSISTGSYVSPILYKGMTSQTSPQYSGWTLNAYSGNLQFTVGGDGGYNVASSAISTGQWYYVVGTRSGSITKLYVNGTEVDSQDAGVTRNVSTSLPFVIGAMKNVTNWYTGILDAMVDDVRFHDRAMDAAEVAYWYAETTASGEQSSGSSYDWTHEGQLTNIVKFVRGQDLNGNPSYAYAKKEDDGTTTLYFTPDLTNFAAFNSYDSGASSIDGSPIFIEYGAGGKVLVGTDTGKVYQIELDAYSVPQSYALLHDVVGGHPVNSLKYGYAMNQWIFEAGGDIYTIPAAGGGAVLRHSLPAGAKVVDFAEGDEGKVAFIVRMADFSIEPRMAPADWSVIYGPSSMVTDASVATDFNYSHAMDLWVSSNADGSSIVTVSDLLDYLS